MLKWAIIGFCSVVLLFFAILGLIQTSAVKDQISSRVSELLGSSPDQQVHIGKLQGFIPFTIRIDRVQLGDKKGIWLTLDDLLFQWSPLKLLHGTFYIDEIKASLLSIERLPEGSEKKKKTEEFKPFELPQKVPGIIVKTLTVSRLSLKPEVLGHAGDFRLSGSVVQLKTASGLQASLELSRLDDGPATRANLAVQLRTDPSDLAVDFDFHEDPGGWVAQVANIKDLNPLDLSLHGKGPLNAWKGKLAGKAEPYGSLQTSIDLAVADQIKLALNGAYSVGSMVNSPQLSPLIGSKIDFDFLGQLKPSEWAEITKATIRTKDANARLAGSFDFNKQEFKSEFNFKIDNLSTLEGFADMPLAGQLSLQGAFSGPVDQPQGKLSLELQKVEAKGYRVGFAEANLQLAPLGPLTSNFSGIKITGEGKAENLTSMDGKTLPEQALRWSLNGKVRENKDILIDSFEVTGEHLQFKLAGDYDPTGMAGTLNANLQIDDLKPVTGFVGEQLPGAASIEAHLKGDRSSGSASGQIRGSLKTAKGFPEKPAAFLGDKATFETEFELTKGAQLEVPKLQLESPVFQFEAKASANLSDKTLLGNWHFSLPKLALLTPVAGKPLSGSLQAKGEVEGKFDAVKATATVEGEQVSLDKMKLQSVLLKANVKDLPKTPDGNVTLVLQKKTARIAASTVFSLEGRRLALQPISLEAPGTELKGEVTADLDKTLLKGYVKGRIKNLSDLGRFLEQPMAGSGTLDIELSPGKKGQDVKALVKVRGLSAPFAKAKIIDLSADLKNTFKTPQGSATVTIKDFESSDLTISTLSLKASGGEDGMKFQSSIEGRSIAPFNLRTNGFVGLSGDSKQIRIESFNGKLGTYPIKLYKPLSFDMSDERFSLNNLALGIGKGRVRGSGRLDQKKVNVDVSFENLPLEMSGLFNGPEINGSAEGRVGMAGSSANPRANFDLRLKNVRSAEPDFKNLPPIQLSASARLQQSVLSLNSEIQGITEKPASANARVPVKFSLEPFDFSVPDSGNIAGHLELEANLTRLSQLVPLDAQTVSGKAVANVDIAGRVKSPRLSGFLNLENVSYQNYITGTVLKSLNARIVADGERFTIQQFQASDGGNGNIKASGFVSVDKEKNFPVNLDVSLVNATLVRRSDVTAQVDGNLDVEGNAADIAVKGNLQVSPAEVTLPQRLPAEMTELNVIEIHEKNSNQKTAQKAEPQATAPMKLALNIKVRLPNRVYVRGWGLDSEWRGNLKITGTSAKPSIVGSLSSIRGKVDFLNKRFDIKRGNITFYGGSPPMPNVDIVAESQVTDITATITFSGPASDPKMALSSTPALPSDEILSKLLFGRSATDITPSQALQLAMIARSLAGRGGTGSDFMSRTRKFLGLDTLEFNSSGEGLDKGTLGIGKYLTEGVRLDIEKGIGESANKAAVEVEVTPNITVESEVGSDSTSGIGVNWKYDY